MSGFLQVDKGYYDDKELKPIDMLVLSQIKEFNRNGCDCYITNKQFAENFHVGEKTIERTIDKLEQGGYIVRKTTFVSGFGKANRQRVLSIKNSKQNATVKTTLPNDNGTVNLSNGIVKNSEWNRHNDAIKDNKEENKNKNNTSPEDSVIDKKKLESGYNYVTDYLGIQCSKQEFIDACNKYDNVDYNNIVYFGSFYKDGMSIFEFIDVVKNYIG